MSGVPGIGILPSFSSRAERRLSISTRSSPAEARASPLRGRVELVEECGPHRVVAVHALGQTLRFAVGNDRSFAPGDAVAIELPPERLLLWPADSSAR